MNDAYLWGLSRSEAAPVVGLTDAQLKNFQQRYVIFPEKREGSGRVSSFDFRDIMKLGVFVQMMDDGFSAPQAADAVSPYSVYGSLFEPVHQFAHYPGVFFVSKNHEGRWVGMDGPKAVSRYEVRLWVLFDKLWPKFVDAVMAADWQKTSLREREIGLLKFRDEMKARREAMKG